MFQVDSYRFLVTFYLRSAQEHPSEYINKWRRSLERPAGAILDFEAGAHGLHCIMLSKFII